MNVLFLMCLVVVMVAEVSSNRYVLHEKNELLKKHNEFRRKEAYEARAEFMLKTMWDEELAHEASVIAESCEILPIDDRTRKYEMSYGTGTDYNHLGKLFDKWYSNKRFYNYNTERCNSDDLKCGQYLNIVGDITDKIGCGRKMCLDIKGVGKVEPMTILFVCLYNNSPKLTYNEGYYFSTPYNQRNSCLKCQNGWRDENSLCANIMG